MWYLFIIQLYFMVEQLLLYQQAGLIKLQHIP